MPTTKLNKFTIHYQNFEEYHLLKQEVFGEDMYYFEIDEDAGVRANIIDIGAHIGLSTLYFKYLFPLAQITAIEPHPANFKILEDNIWQNELDDVTAIQAAVIPGKEKTITLHADTEHSWFSTASLQERAWNLEQQTQPLQVPALQLSTLLQQHDHIDLLKIDIEGFEQAVIEEAQDYLDRVNLLLIEFHPVKHQSLLQLWQLLGKKGFTVTSNKGKRNVPEPFKLQIITARKK